LNSHGLFESRPITQVQNDNLAVTGVDVPRDQLEQPPHKALIAEIRNDDVLIVTQLHAFFQRLHNAIIAAGYAVDWKDAKSKVIIIFQLLVVEEFTKNILDKKVFQAYFERGERHYSNWDKTKIPTFFSHAAFRFGHSMVRSDYQLNASTRFVSVADFFTSNQKLIPERVVDWSAFFKHTDQTQRAMRIDGSIASAMSAVKPLDNSFELVDVIKRNLSASLLELPKGADLIGLLASFPDSLKSAHSSLWLDTFEDSEFAKSLHRQGVSTNVEDLPLWPFILLEAQHTQENGISSDQLGTVGSIMVAEVFANALSNDPNNPSQYSVVTDSIYDQAQAFTQLGALGQLLEPKNRFDTFGFMKVLTLVQQLEQKVMR
jgi:hypothetical protein